MSTIRDVARMSGVSTATVSNVINARAEKVSIETRERVLAAIRTLRYVSTPLEKNQTAIRTNNLALVCGDLSHSPVCSNAYFGGVLDGVLEAAALRSWSVTVFVERMWSDSEQVVRRKYDGRCDGVIVIAPDRHSELVRSLLERGTPIVSVGTTADQPGVSSVDIDNEFAGYELTRYLVELNHAAIAYIGPNFQSVSSRERCDGYRQAMRDFGLSDQIQLALASGTAGDASERNKTKPTATSFLGGEHVAIWGSGPLEKILSNACVLPTALVCWNEGFARQCIESLERMGVRVPEDVSVAAFDDGPAATSIVPYLTTMRQPFAEIGKRAVDLLVARIMDPDITHEPIKFKAELVVRDSTGPIAADEKSRARHLHKLAELPTEVNPK